MPETPIIYGIVNCDTMRKARRWLRDNGIVHEFHDYKKHGIDTKTLEHWVGVLGWEVLLNRRGTTFRKLDSSLKDHLDEKKAIEIMASHTSAIKRPVIAGPGDALLVGFDEAQYARLFSVV